MSGRKENILFSSKENRTTQEIGAFLIQIGEKLKNEGLFTLNQGSTTIEVHPRGPTKLELEYEVKGEKHEFELEIEWRPNREGEGPVQVT